jgi:hydroxymethylglutaryl-CoA lyase
MITLTECPRDAMQGIKNFIPTDVKADYLNLLLTVGFDVLDFGSFVSPKAVPQMSDTAKIVNKLKLSDTQTQLLAIIANERGALEACQFEEITFLGFPFSVSEEFQMRNTRSTRSDSLESVKRIQELCDTYSKRLIIYLSMGFGNPYGEDWSTEIVMHWTEKITDLGIANFALSDTIGSSHPMIIKTLFADLVRQSPSSNWGLHLHTTPDTWQEKIEAAFQAGCRRFDGAINGYGGCPMAKDELTGNMPTEKIVQFLDSQVQLNIDRHALSQAIKMAEQIFP